MAESYSVEAVLKASGADKFARQFKNATNNIRGVENSTDRASISIKKMIGVAAGIAGTIGLFRTLRDSVNLAFDRIDTMEQFDRVMTEITGSTESAKKALDDTNEAVIGTAYGLDIAAKGVQDFVTRGMEVDKATETIAAWGDAVAFYGKGSNEELVTVTDALAKMSTKGTVEMEQMNRLFDVGINAVGMYAQATDKSVSEVQDALSAGEISSEKFISTVTTAMMEGTNGVTNISGAAKEAGTSWSGSFANMRAATARGITNVIGSIDQMLTSNGLPDMRAQVALFGEYMESAMSKAAESIGPFVERAKEIYSAIKPWIPLVAAAIAGIVAFKSTIGIINTVKNTITALKVAFALLNATILANPIALIIAAVVAAAILIYAYWDPISEFFKNLWEGIKEVSLSVWESLKSAWQSVVEGFMSIWTPISEFFVGIWDGIKEIFNTALNFIKETISRVMNSEIVTELIATFEFWKSIFTTTWNFISNVVTTFIGILKKVIGGWLEEKKTQITTVMGVIKTVFKTVWNAIYSIIEPILNLIKTIITTVFGAIKTFIKATWNAIKGIFEVVWGFISGIVSTHINNIKAVISIVMNAIKTAFKVVWEIIKGIFVSVLRFLRGDVDGAMDRIKQTITNVMGLVSGFFSKTWNTIKDTFTSAFKNIKNTVKDGLRGALDIITNLFGKFKDAGRNVVTSIADGIKGAVGKVTGAISNVTSKIRDFLPFSPAKKGALRDIMDVKIVESIAKSIDKGKNTAQKAMAGVSRAIHGEMPNVDVGGQINSINKQSRKQMSYDFTNELSINRQPIEINIYDNKEAVRAYVNENNAIDAEMRRF